MVRMLWFDKIAFVWLVMVWGCRIQKANNCLSSGGNEGESMVHSHYSHFHSLAFIIALSPLRRRRPLARFASSLSLAIRYHMTLLSAVVTLDILVSVSSLLLALLLRPLVQPSLCVSVRSLFSFAFSIFMTASRWLMVSELVHSSVCHHILNDWMMERRLWESQQHPAR